MRGYIEMTCILVHIKSFIHSYYAIIYDSRLIMETADVEKSKIDNKYDEIILNSFGQDVPESFQGMFIKNLIVSIVLRCLSSH